jgi:hypothetical protein
MNDTKCPVYEGERVKDKETDFLMHDSWKKLGSGMLSILHIHQSG